MMKGKHLGRTAEDKTPLAHHGGREGSLSQSSAASGWWYTTLYIIRRAQAMPTQTGEQEPFAGLRACRPTKEVSTRRVALKDEGWDRPQEEKRHSHHYHQIESGWMEEKRDGVYTVLTVSSLRTLVPSLPALLRGGRNRLPGVISGPPLQPHSGYQESSVWNQEQNSQSSLTTGS